MAKDGDEFFLGSVQIREVTPEYHISGGVTGPKKVESRVQEAFSVTVKAGSGREAVQALLQQLETYLHSGGEA